MNSSEFFFYFAIHILEVSSSRRVTLYNSNPQGMLLNTSIIDCYLTVTIFCSGIVLLSNSDWPLVIKLSVIFKDGLVKTAQEKCAIKTEKKTVRGNETLRELYLIFNTM